MSDCVCLCLFHFTNAELQQCCRRPMIFEWMMTKQTIVLSRMFWKLDNLIVLISTKRKMSQWAWFWWDIVSLRQWMTILHELTWKSETIIRIIYLLEINETNNVIVTRYCCSVRDSFDLFITLVLWWILIVLLLFDKNNRCRVSQQWKLMCGLIYQKLLKNKIIIFEIF